MRPGEREAFVNTGRLFAPEEQKTTLGYIRRVIRPVTTSATAQSKSQ